MTPTDATPDDLGAERRPQIELEGQRICSRRPRTPTTTSDHQRHHQRAHAKEYGSCPFFGVWPGPLSGFRRAWLGQRTQRVGHKRERLVRVLQRQVDRVRHPDVRLAGDGQLERDSAPRVPTEARARGTTPGQTSLPGRPLCWETHTRRIGGTTPAMPSLSWRCTRFSR